MAESATIQRPARTVGIPADGTQTSVRTWARDDEVIALLDAADLRARPHRARKLYTNKLNHGRALYRRLVDRDAHGRAGVDGWIHVTHVQLGADYRDDIDPRSVPDRLKCRVSNRRWLKWLAASGLIEWRESVDRHNRYDGLVIRLLPVPACDDAIVGPDSSAGSSSGPWERVSETRRERQANRVKPRCRRAGHGSEPVFRRRRGSGPLFSGPELVPSGVRPGGRDYVPSPPGRTDLQVGACVRASNGSSDRGRPWHGQRRAAVEALVEKSPREGWFEPLRQAALAGTDPLVVAEAAWELAFGSPAPGMSQRRIGQLYVAVAQGDRATGYPGAAIELLLTQVETHYEQPPVSLAFFVCIVRQAVVRWRRRAQGKPELPDTGQQDRQRAQQAAERAAERERAAAHRDSQRRRRC